MKQQKCTVSMLNQKITACMNQEKKALALSDWEQAEWCRSAARLYRDRLEIAKVKGYWEHEYDPIPDLVKTKSQPKELRGASEGEERA